jgi:transcriptional regulator with XRE-family HTH domain
MKGHLVEPQWGRLGEAIRRQRRREGMNQDDLAKAANLSKRTIGNYERGRAPEGALGVPDGYYDVARVLGWTPRSVDDVLRGEEPTVIADQRDVSAAAFAALIDPVFALTDVARDAGAPTEIVTRFRVAAAELAGWLSAHGNKGSGRALSPDVAPEDSERILSELEDNPDGS